MKEITSSADLELTRTATPALLLKYGTTCPISAHARDEVAAFAKAHPEIPIYGLDVRVHRELSTELADQLSVKHESPQLLLLRGGRVAWYAEHYDITAKRIASHL